MFFQYTVDALVLSAGCRLTKQLNGEQVQPRESQNVGQHLPKIRLIILA